MGIFSSLLAANLFGCGTVDIETVSGTEGTNISGEIYTEALMATDVSSEEEAQKIAAQYGIDFVSFGLGVATYSTVEDPQSVIDRGEKEGLTPLYLNNSLNMD